MNAGDNETTKEYNPKSGYYTIGGSNVERTNLKIPSDYITFRTKTAKGQSVMSNFVNNGNNKINTVILLFENMGKKWERKLSAIVSI